MRKRRKTGDWIVVSKLLLRVLLSQRALLLSLLAPLTFHSAETLATEYTVSDVETLAAALRQYSANDVLLLKKGVYHVRFSINKPDVTLRGEKGTIIDAANDGIAIKVRKPGVRIQNLEIRNYGRDLKARHAGVRVYQGAHDVRLDNLKLSGPGFGIRADRVNGLHIENCEIAGDEALSEIDREDGVFLKHVNNPVLRNNRISNVRDGFYLEYVKGSRVTENTFDGTVYAVHFMYTSGDEASHNTATRARGAWALMDSENIKLHHCRADINKVFGILLNVANGCEVHDNIVTRTSNPEGNAASNTDGKAIFIYGPGKNSIHDNIFSDSDIGISMAMGGEGNLIWRNAFLNNRVQVRYVGEKPLEWSHEGIGNYWSTHLGWDIDKDGIGDRPYQPNDSLDRIFWIYPEALFLMDSPVVALMRWISNQFELDRGKGVTDSHPLMSFPASPAFANLP